MPAICWVESSRQRAAKPFTARWTWPGASGKHHLVSTPPHPPTPDAGKPDELFRDYVDRLLGAVRTRWTDPAWRGDRRHEVRAGLIGAVFVVFVGLYAAGPTPWLGERFVAGPTSASRVACDRVDAKLEYQNLVGMAVASLRFSQAWCWGSGRIARMPDANVQSTIPSFFRAVGWRYQPAVILDGGLRPSPDRRLVEHVAFISPRFCTLWACYPRQHPQLTMTVRSEGSYLVTVIP